MAPNDRISQIASHLNYPRGLLAGQVAIVTGAGQGIGAETARLFANEGAKVVVSDIDGEKASAVANSINSNGGKALAVPGDMLDDAYLKTLIEKTAEFGEGKIHIIVNNAGFTWDGVIHKVCLLPFYLLINPLSDIKKHRQQTNNGTPSCPSTSELLSSSSATPPPTSASKTTHLETSSTSPQPQACTATQAKQTTQPQKQQSPA
jgi:hypothetical protein